MIFEGMKIKKKIKIMEKTLKLKKNMKEKTLNVIIYESRTR